MSKHLQENAPATFERYSSGEQKTFMGLPEYTGLAANRIAATKKSGEELTMAISSLEGTDDAIKQALVDNLAVDQEAIKASDIYGGRRALTLTAMVPAGMAVGFLILLIYFKAIGGYKPIALELTDNAKGA